ncbi:LamG domain-containing protein [Isoptericola luteus]|nr:LamG domain-containing protein [Isoptericola sp. NEAU-Y5]
MELTSARSAWDTVFVTPAGETRVEMSAAAVRTDVNGSWEPVDTTLSVGQAGVVAAAPALPVVFSDGTAGMPLATIERDGHVLEFDVPFDLTVPQVDGDRVTYPQVLPGVDLIASIDADGTGFSEVLRVASPEAAANPALAQLAFDVQVSEGLTVSESGGGFVAVDGAGEAVFSSPTPLMWDSGSIGDAAAGVEGSSSVRSFAAAGEAVGDVVDGDSGEPVVGDPVAAPALDSAVAVLPARVAADGGDSSVVSLTPDAGMLADEATSWPVFIDPSVSGSRNEWTAIRSGMSSDYKFSGDQGLGMCDVSVASSCGQDFVSRLVWEFRGKDLSTISGVASGDITSATFSAYGAHSYNCTAYGVRAYNVENIAEGTTWSSNSGWTDANLQSTQDVAHKSGCDDGPRRVSWDVEQAAQEAASANHSYITIGLKAATETTMARWKRYRNDAKLSVSYNQAPKTPWDLDIVPNGGTAVKCGASAWMRDATPQLRARIGDPDGDRVYHNFNVYRSSGAMHYNGPFSAASYANGSLVSRTVPSSDALTTGSYEFRVQAKDTGGRAGPGAGCTFNVDVTPPNTPTVSPVAGQPAVYTTGVETGGIGVVGKFAVGNNGSSDVTHFLYSWNDANAVTTELSGSSGTITFDPRAPGPHTLRVQAVDRAGNASEVRAYTVDVAPPREDAAWELNERSGTVGADFLGRQDLQIASTSMWTDGPFLDRLPGNSALLFDDAADTAATLGPVVRTDDSFVVSAHVRLDSLGSYAAALSQDGVESNGFWLGYAPPNRCATSTGDGCWIFSMRPEDGASGPIATSELAVVEGKWVYLVGSYDKVAGQMKLTVCDPLPVDDDPFDGVDPDPVESATAALGSSWFADGPLQVGRVKSSGKYTSPWRGAVDNVRVYDGQLLDADDAKIWRVCTGAPMFSTVPGGDLNDPTEKN